VDAEKLRDMTEEELVDKLKDAKAELFNLRFQLATGQLDNSNKIKEAKKDIARIQTVRKEREIEVKLSRS
jgi:large subunit ribosomal protein L29